MIPREHLRTLIEHRGAMFLLDDVLEWDDTRVTCTATSHRDSANPLRRAGALAAVHLIEYGAQAMALHHGLQAEVTGEERIPGWLVAVKGLELKVSRLDGVESPLVVTARCLLVYAGGLLYEFTVEAGGNRLASGRISAVSARRQPLDIQSDK